MAGDAVFYSVPMLLRFDSYEGGIAKGRLKTLRHKGPFPFESMDQLLMIMDDVLDAEAFPREAGEFRRLKAGRGASGPVEKKSGEKAYAFRRAGREGLFLEDGAAPPEGGFRGQMAVTVCRRRHGSMQGVVNVEGEKTSFRSALELMHMLHEYLEDSFPACMEGFPGGC